MVRADTVTHRGDRSGYNKNYIPCWDEECELLYKEHIDSENAESASTATSLRNVLDEKRRQRWNETVSYIDFRILAAKRGKH